MLSQSFMQYNKKGALDCMAAIRGLYVLTTAGRAPILPESAKKQEGGEEEGRDYRQE